MWHFNDHVLLDRNLAGQPAAFASFAFVDVPFFCVQNVAATLEHFNDALGTGSTAATGRRHKDAFFTKCIHQLAASGNFNFRLTVD